MMTDIDKEDGLKLFSPLSNVDETKSPEAAKFIPESENKNGISPISVDHLKAKFAGLTKEELMKFANDPFWVRLRWFLFILFWLIWVLMLFAAVSIIIVTPKCQQPPPLEWWERSPLYVLDVKKLVPDSAPEINIIGILKNKINYLKQHLGIESLLLKSVMESKMGAYDEIMNFTNVNLNLDSVDSFHRDIIEYAKSQGVQIMIGFSPEYSGKMIEFIRSSAGEEEYKDFYVWYPESYPTKPNKPPNNWLSVYNTPAWEWDDLRKQFYLHQFNVSQPDLNYRNPAVVEFMSNVLKFWLNLGIRGFFLDKTEYLLEDKQFSDEMAGQNAGLNHDQYGFFLHSRTFEVPENVQILEKWNQIIKNASGIVCVSGGILDKKEIADFVLRPISLHQNFTANDLRTNISHWISAVSHPTWEWKCSPPNAKCIPDTHLNGLTIVSFLLPGVPVIHFDDEFKGSNATDLSSDGKSNETISNSSGIPENRLQLIKKLTELRASPGCSFGGYQSFVINGSVFAFTRIKAGNPGYLVTWNLSNKKLTINFQDYIQTVPGDLNVVIKSSPSAEESNESGNKVSSSAVTVPANSAVVFSFVPSLK